MKTIINRMVAAASLASMLVISGFSNGQTLITDFNTFFENELYASWNAPEAIIDSGPDSYSVTATGYGSNYVYIGNLGILGAGNTHLELDVTLSSTFPEADGHLGPIITLVDGDNTRYSYAWYGQLLGDHILTMPVATPTIIGNPGTTPGLDLDTLMHMHMELDPGGFGTTGPYTVEWKNLNLITVEGTPGDFDADGDVDGRDFLVWQRGDSPIPLGAADLADWQENYGAGALVAFTAVPEPSTVGLMIIAGVSAVVRRPTKQPAA